MATLTTDPPPLPGRRAGLTDYLKHALLYRWNLLLLIGGVLGATLTPWPDALLPLVGAAEALYLAALVSSQKFRRAVDARVYQQLREPQVAESQRTLQRILDSLPPASRSRFDKLRARCLEMRAIADGVRGRTGATAAQDLGSTALDRLLWVFLRLLVSQESLNRFLEHTDPAEIRSHLEDARSRLSASDAGERVKRSLEDSVAVQEMRLDNYQKAAGNADFLRVEIDRIEAKIHALTEAAVNRQDTEFLSSQIDSVAESMQSTAKAISELQSITGLVDEMQEPPAILTADLGGSGGK